MKEEKVKQCLKILFDAADKEDRETRERQIRLWRKLKLYWDGFQRIWYSETAHDWRTPETAQSDEYGAYYDKTINTFRAYLESLIAALSITIPPVRCVPDDADNNLDLATARTGDKIAKLIYRHNDVPLLWIHALFVYCTEGLVTAYNYSKEDEKYGTYSVNDYQVVDEEDEFFECPHCGARLVDDNVCPRCMMEIETPIAKQEVIQNEKLVGITNKPKSRQLIEIYGGLHVKVPNYARKQEDCPYLIWAYETHYSEAKSRYPELEIQGGSNAADHYERWGRNPIQYLGDEPKDTVTCRNCWFRPSYFNILNEDDAKELKKMFPSGVKAILINESVAEAVEESLDDHWTLTRNPLSDYLHHEPIGVLLTSIQDITNDIISLVLQTMEHGIPQTFADPGVLDFDAYRKTEVTPGYIFPAKPRTGQNLGQAFYEVRTATLSQEIQPFSNKIQELGQLVSGALPSLFGGPSPGSSRTAAEYAMSRAQALQRLQIPWKMFTFWWEDIFGKVIPAYIRDVMEDERFVEKDEQGNYINIFIRRAELQGKIGRVELEANENMPVTFAQKKDAIMELMQTGHPAIIEGLTAPENVRFLSQVIGLDEFTIPNQNDIDKQYEEIQALINSEPLSDTVPSIEVDPDLDNHIIEAETCRRWLVSPAGRQAKIDTPAGYRNVLLHMKMHVTLAQPPQQPMPPPQQNAPKPQLPEQQPVPMEEGLDYGPEPAEFPVQ